ncbi:MAG: methyltransferase domain-containing protein [Ruminiclostridium sp.]|nr:methyltransferase domain-containing protein [Ruminiclostridium sp.]
MSIVKCPVCGNVLVRSQNAYVCERNHSFDIAAKGYVNLLPSNRKNSKQPGDNKQMIHSRNIFLNAGFYAKLSETINTLVLQHLSGKQVGREAHILDSGCGEGYYLASLAKTFTSRQIHASFYGIDISKEAMRIAAGRSRDIFFAVASSFDLPVMSETIDCLLQAFSPCSDAEFHRVLRKDGLLISVIPGRKHLLGLKQFLYEQPYENDEMEYPLTSFQKVDQVRVSYSIALHDRELIGHLFRMTPYFWRTGAEKVKELEQLETLETLCEFVITVYSPR